MNNFKLYTFGCSFTENFEYFFHSKVYDNRKKYIIEHLGGIVPLSWPEILSKKLNMDLINKAAVHGYEYENYGEGNCNASIFNNICHMCDEFKKGDIVIVQWSFITRFKWATEQGMISILPNHYRGVDMKLTEEIIVNRSHKLWIDELFVMMKILNKLAESNEFEIYYWTIDDTILDNKEEIITNDKRWLLSNKIKETNYIKLVNEKGGKSIKNETNDKIKDDHLGITGHNILADMFYEYIIKK